jgi:hypothetical protein
MDKKELTQSDDGWLAGCLQCVVSWALVKHPQVLSKVLRKCKISPSFKFREIVTVRLWDEFRISMGFNKESFSIH